MSITVTTWYLEQTSPEDLRPSPAPGGDLRIERAGVPSPEFSRFLYTAVGGDLCWVDRLGLTYAQWREILERPGAETWVAYVQGTPAGYVELKPHDPDGGVVEIIYFGLLPAFRGRGIGGHLLSYGTARAWDLGGPPAGADADEAGGAEHLLPGRRARHDQLPAAGLPAVRHEDGRAAGGPDARRVARCR